MQSSDSNIYIIRDWSDGFVALKHHAEDVCGAVESDLQAGERQRWPRTSGADVLLVAAFLDPSVRSLVARGDHGSASLDRCWRACLQDLERWAVVYPSDEYLDNRRFWSDVLTATVHLSAASSRVPAQREWDALISAVGAPERNGASHDAPFGPFPPAADDGDVFVAQRKHLMSLRGFDRLAPEAGMTGGIMPIPRTTYADLLPLLAFWDARLKSVPQLLGHDGVVRQWHAAASELIELLKTAEVSEVYPKNSTFWRALVRVSTQVSVASPKPPGQQEWEALLSSLEAKARNGVPRDVPFGPFANAGDFGDVFVAQRKHLMTLRGVDRLPPEPGMTGGIMPIPRTTYTDLMPLVTFWGAQLKAAKEIAGQEAVNRQWNAAVTELGALIKTANPSSVYPKNQAFWRALSRVSTHVNMADGAPSKTERILDSLAFGVKEAPATIVSAASAAAKGTAEVVGEVAGGAGKLAGSLLGGLFSGIGVPLVVGGGALGAYLLLRGRGARGEA
jgi:hypothetical protein